MKKLVKISIFMQVIVQEKSFKYYYDNMDTVLYNICYIKEKEKLYKSIDMESQMEDSIYIAHFYFKLDTLKSAPKISYGLHIFENGKEIESKIKIIKISYEIIKKENN